MVLLKEFRLVQDSGELRMVEMGEVDLPREGGTITTGSLYSIE